MSKGKGSQRGQPMIPNESRVPGSKNKHVQNLTSPACTCHSTAGGLIAVSNFGRDVLVGGTWPLYFSSSNQKTGTKKARPRFRDLRDNNKFGSSYGEVAV